MPLSDDLGCRHLPPVKMSPETTIGDLVLHAQENVCFDVLYAALGRLERAEPIIVDNVNLTGEVHGLLSVLKWQGCNVSQFSPPWLARVRELLDTIAKEAGYEPPKRDDPDGPGSDQGHEDED